MARKKKASTPAKKWWGKEEYKIAKKIKRDSQPTVKLHQKDLAKISGTTAAKAKSKKLPKDKGNERIAGRNAGKVQTAYKKAVKKTLKSFK